MRPDRRMPPLQVSLHPRSERLQVARRDEIHPPGGPSILVGIGPTEELAEAAAAEGHRHAAANVGNTGQGAQAVDQRFAEREPLVARVVRRVRQRQIKRQHPCRIETGIFRGGVDETPHQERRRRQQHHGEGHLGGDQQPLGSLTRRARTAAAAVAEGTAHVDAPRTQSRQPAGKQRRCQRRAERE